MDPGSAPLTRLVRDDGILLVSYIVYVIGACLCGVGLLVSAPVALVAIIYSYRALNNELVTP